MAATTFMTSFDLWQASGKLHTVQRLIELLSDDLKDRSLSPTRESATPALLAHRTNAVQNASQH